MRKQKRGRKKKLPENKQYYINVMVRGDVLMKFCPGIDLSRKRPLMPDYEPLAKKISEYISAEYQRLTKEP